MSDKIIKTFLNPDISILSLNQTVKDIVYILRKDYTT